MKAERAKNPNTFVTHGGDTLSPSLMSGFDQGEHMIALFNAIGLDALAPGNHEFDHGHEVYRKRVSEAKFPFLAANMRDGDGSVLAGHRDTMIVERERDLAISATNRQDIEEIDAALARLATGMYGYSVQSYRPIPRERLEFIPWATLLVEEKVGGIGR